MDLEFRPPSTDELRSVGAVVAIALLQAPHSDEAWGKSEPTWQACETLSAFDGGACVGSVSEFLVDSTVPGGTRLPTAAITRVGVLPTHRRQGVATRLMERIVVEALGRGRMLASLRASETIIYPRFGFGVAGENASAVIDTHRARPLRCPPIEGSFRLLDRGEVLDVIPELYDRVAHTRPGIISRPDWVWRRYLEEAMSGTAASFVAVHLDTTSQPDGYVHYDVSWKDDFSEAPAGQGKIHEVYGATPEVELALWRYLLDIDLVRTWRADERPLDDVANFAVADSRAYAIKAVGDEQWLRLLDVDVALGARSYNPTDRAVAIMVRDPLLSNNCGTWRIDAYGAFRSHQEPDLIVGIETISAAYLGGTPWWGLHAAGAVKEQRPGAVADADTLFASRPMPYCGTFF
ncbi:MAG: GNAT family N-acetyltransferase [Ilumatobacteraceae bacterium]